MLRKLFTKSHEQKFRRVWMFLADDVWDVELSSLKGLRRFGVQIVRVVQLVFKGYKQDECPLHASALTFNTMMAIVPILALSLAVARGFGGDDAAKSWVKTRVSEWTQEFGRHDVDAGVFHPEIASSSVESETSEQANLAAPMPQESNTTLSAATPPHPRSGITPEELAHQINSLVETTFEKVDAISFKALGGVGLGLLLWMVISALGRVEASFNRVWGVSEPRPLWRKFTDYFSILLVFPVLIIAASSLPVVDYTTRFLDAANAVYLRHLLFSGALKNLTMITFTCLSFSFLLISMPNTSVKVRPGLVGGCVTGLLFLLTVWACASIQIGVASAGRIYGTFAVLPIMLLWVNISWQLVFLGAEVAFAVQNCSTYRMEQGARRANVWAKLTMALSLVVEASKSMDGSRPHFTVDNFAGQYRVPVRLLNEVVQELVVGQVLAKISDSNGSYVMSRAPEFVKVTEILDVMLQGGVDAKALGLDHVETTARDIIEEVHGKMFDSLDGVSLRDLLTRVSETDKV